jgi:hypothetical protein
MVLFLMRVRCVSGTTLRKGRSVGTDASANRGRTQRVPAEVGGQNERSERRWEMCRADPDADQGTEEAIGELDGADPEE